MRSDEMRSDRFDTKQRGKGRTKSDGARRVKLSFEFVESMKIRPLVGSCCRLVVLLLPFVKVKSRNNRSDHKKD